MLLGEERVLPLKEGNNVLLIQQAGRLFGRTWYCPLQFFQNSDILNSDRIWEA